MCDERSPLGQPCEQQGQHSLHTAGLTSNGQVEVWH